MTKDMLGFIPHQISLPPRCKARPKSSKWSRNLPRLPHPSNVIPHLTPTNWHTSIPLITPRHDDSKLIRSCAKIITSLIAQADHQRTHNVAHVEALSELHFVLLGRAHVLGA